MSSVVSPYSLYSENINKQQMRDLSREIYMLLIRPPAMEKAGFSLPLPMQTEETFSLLGPQNRCHFGKQFRIFPSTVHEEQKL